MKLVDLMVGVVPESSYNVQLSDCNFLKLTNRNSWEHRHLTIISHNLTGKAVKGDLRK